MRPHAASRPASDPPRCSHARPAHAPHSARQLGRRRRHAPTPPDPSAAGHPARASPHHLHRPTTTKGAQPQKPRAPFLRPRSRPTQADPDRAPAAPSARHTGNPSRPEERPTQAAAHPGSPAEGIARGHPADRYHLPTQAAARRRRRQAAAPTADPRRLQTVAPMAPARRISPRYHQQMIPRPSRHPPASAARRPPIAHPARRPR